MLFDGLIVELFPLSSFVALIIAVVAILTVSFYRTRRGPMSAAPDETAGRTRSS